MGQGATEGVVSPPQVTGQPARPSPDGLAAEIAAVEEARARMAESLEQLQSEARTQVGVTVERILWKMAAAGAAVVVGLATRKAVDVAWRTMRKGQPPRGPGDPSASWAEALGWAAATAVGAAVGRVVAERGAAAGWRRATGRFPPGLERD